MSAILLFRLTDTEGLPHMTQNTPVKASGTVPQGCRTGRPEHRPRRNFLIIFLLGLIFLAYPLVASQVSVTTLSASLATIVLTMDILDRLSGFPLPRRS